MEYSIKPKMLGERRIIHYPQKRIIGLYVLDMDYIKEKLYQQLAIDYCCQVSDIKDDKIILQNMKSLKAGDSLKKRMIVS